MNFVTLALVTAVLATILQAQTVVVENLVDVVPNSFTVGEVADIDADGHLDLVLSGGRIRWGQAAGFSGAVQALDPTSGSRALVVADFNGDNLPDIAAGWDQSPEVHLFWNRGNRVFEAEFIDNTRGTNWLVAVDVDEDGVLDLVSADRLESGEVVWYRKGETEWVAETIAASLTQPFALAAGNLDADEALELVVSTIEGIYLIDSRNPGDPPGERFLAPQALFVTDVEGRHLVAKDLDGDGDLDIALAIRSIDGDGSDSKVGWLRNEGDLSFTYFELATGSGSYFRWIAAADVDGDGDPDIVASRWGSSRPSRFLFLLNNGQGGFKGHEVRFGDDTGSMYSFACWPLPDGREAILPGVDLTNGTGWPRLVVPHTGLSQSQVDVRMAYDPAGNSLSTRIRATPGTYYRYEFSNDLRIWSSSYRAGNRLIQIEEQTSSNGLPIFGLLPLPTGDEFYFRVIGVREVE